MVRDYMPEAAPDAQNSGRPEEPAPRRRLYRSRKDRMLAGVAGGLALYFGLDPVAVRLGFVLLAAGSGIGIITYIVLALITPEWPAEQDEPEARVSPIELGKGWVLAGYVLVLLGIVSLLDNLGWLSMVHGQLVGPVFLMLVGLAIIMHQRRGTTL